MKLLAKYTLDIHWPRSVCCFSEGDGSLIVCEQDRCRLLLFTSRLMLRSICGGTRGHGTYEFDSPSAVATSFDESSPSTVLVADTNNRRVQYFTIRPNGTFSLVNTRTITDKPVYIASSREHLAVSCENAVIITFENRKRKALATIHLRKLFVGQGNLCRFRQWTSREREDMCMFRCESHGIRAQYESQEQLPVSE